MRPPMARTTATMRTRTRTRSRAKKARARERRPLRPAAKAGREASAKSGSSDFKRGRKAERRRIGLILSNPAAAPISAFACKLACNTGMSSSAAIALLEQTPAAPAQRGGRLDRAMSDAKVPEVKAGAPTSPRVPPPFRRPGTRSLQGPVTAHIIGLRRHLNQKLERKAS
jgi:hypothetical protein